VNILAIPLNKLLFRVYCISSSSISISWINSSIFSASVYVLLRNSFVLDLLITKTLCCCCWIGCWIICCMGFSIDNNLMCYFIKLFASNWRAFCSLNNWLVSFCSLIRFNISINNKFGCSAITGAIIFGAIIIGALSHVFKCLDRLDWCLYVLSQYLQEFILVVWYTDDIYIRYIFKSLLIYIYIISVSILLYNRSSLLDKHRSGYKQSNIKLDSRYYQDTRE